MSSPEQTQPTSSPLHATVPSESLRVVRKPWDNHVCGNGPHTVHSECLQPSYRIWEGYISGRGGDTQGGASEGGGAVTGGGVLIIRTNLCVCMYGGGEEGKFFPSCRTVLFSLSDISYLKTCLAFKHYDPFKDCPGSHSQSASAL